MQWNYGVFQWRCPAHYNKKHSRGFCRGYQIAYKQTFFSRALVQTEHSSVFTLDAALFRAARWKTSASASLFIREIGEASARDFLK